MKPEEGSRLDEAELHFFSDLQTLMTRKKAYLSRNVRRICCADAHYVGQDVTAVASLFEDGRQFAVSVYRGRVTFPYSSGLLYLREGPFVVEAVRRLKVVPQLVCFDGHGLAHPRSAGLATTCGAVLRVPSIGVAKSRLVGVSVEYREGLQKIIHEGRVVGFLTKPGGRQRFWSPGYSVGLRQLESIVLRYGQICLEAMEESDRLSKRGSLD